MSEQGDMLGIDTAADPARMIDAGELPAEKWAPLLANLLRVLEARFKRSGTPDPKAYRDAADIVLTIAEYFGGRVVYLPKGEGLRKALLHAEIWRKFTGRNVPELAQEFGLTEIYVYEVLRAQRKLNARKIQGRLFED